MASAVAELDASLMVMATLKPPGVSGTRIQSITALCVANVESESVLIQKLYTHFKKTSPSHKLGVLYVVDSVTRKWTELAKSAGQVINSAAGDGTYAAGVHRVTELLPVLVNDLVQSAPDDQKDKIKKLVDIWEKGQTFPQQMLTDFKEKLNASSISQTAAAHHTNQPQRPVVESFTPPGSPPAHQGGLPKPSATPAAESASILAALGQLANMARQQNNSNNTAVPQASQNHGQAQDSYMSNTQINPASAHALAPVSVPVSVSQAAALNLPFPPVFPPVNVPAAYTQQTQAQGLNNGAPNYASNLMNSYPGTAPGVPPPTTLDPTLQQQLLLIKGLTDAGIPPDQIHSILASLGAQGPPGPGQDGLPAPPPLPFPFPAPGQNAVPQNNQNTWGGPRGDESRDYNNTYGMQNGMRSPSGRPQGRRSRSRSPARGWNNGYASPGGNNQDRGNFDVGRNSPSQNRDDRGRTGRDGGWGNDYRQRSPPRRNQSPSPPSRQQGGGEKWVGQDLTIGQGNIKVLSRTLFVGGVTISEPELRRLFERFGTVQTCIVNKEKRHAFVKMVSRQDAQAARDGMERNRTPDSQLRTRWGVGFGPRDCSDYQTGVSIVPIMRLTDADRKWMLTAEYGGSGGKPIEPFMVVEEPDIEIGQGVSSKAISRRMQTDMSGQAGPKSTREQDEGRQNQNQTNNQNHNHNQNQGQGRRGSRDHGRKKERNSNISGPPSMPPIPAFGLGGFPFNLQSMPNGLPMIPPGFTFPGAQTNGKSTPPGRT